MLAFLLAAALTACDGATAPLIVAHRGGMDSGLPENTLEAFAHAASVGADMIEVDLRTTRDGHLVVLHDPTVDRTTNGRGAVRNLDLVEVRALDAGAGARVPTLDETLDATRGPGLALLFDVKPGPGLDHRNLVRAIAQHDDDARVWFGVRRLADRRRLGAVLPHARFLAFVRRADDIDAFLAAGVDAVRLWPDWLDRDPELIDHVHGAGAAVWITAGMADDDALRALAARGVDAVLTDRPAAAVAAIGCR